MKAEGQNKRQRIKSVPLSHEAPKSIGRYEILGELGRGGMGVVYRAQARKTKQLFALKIINPEHLAKPESALRFKREFRAMQRVEHPNVIRVYHAGTHNNCPYFTMEMVDGQEIGQWLDGQEPIVNPRSKRPPEGVLSPEQRKRLNEPRRVRRAAEAVSQVALALGAIHSHRIVHRDVKPDNILVSRAGVVKLMDFGVAKQGASKNETSSGGLLVGTFKYLSPEQASGANVDARADLYCLGVILFELLAGRHPFHSDTSVGYAYHHAKRTPPPVTRFNPEAHKGLVRICEKLLSKDPDKRYATAEDVVRAIRKALKKDPNDAPLVEETPNAVNIHLFPARLTGREHELSQLVKTFDDSQTRGQLVSVFGDTRYGKTKLLKEAAAQARLKSIDVITGECVEGSDSPYHPYIQVLTTIIDEKANQSIDTLLTFLGDEAAVLARYAPRIEYHFDDLDFKPAPALEPRAERLRFMQAFANTLGRWCQKRRKIIIIEDLQHADELSVSLSEFLAVQQEGESRAGTEIIPALQNLTLWLSLNGSQDKAQASVRMVKRLNKFQCSQEVHLSVLSSEEVGRVLATMTGGAEIAPALADALHQETEGIPGRVEARIQDWVENRRLLYQGQRWVLIKEDPDAVEATPLVALDTTGNQDSQNPLIADSYHDMPGTKVIELAAATRADIPLPDSDEEQPAKQRLMRLSPAGRDVVERMVVIGRQLPGTLAERLALRPEEEFLDALNELLEYNILAEDTDAGTYRFSESQRKVIIQGLSQKRKRSLHQLAARALSEAPDLFSSLSSPLELAKHYLRGGEPQRALRQQMRASRDALAANATQTAAEHVRQAQGMLAKHFPDKNESPEVIELDAELVLLRLDILSAVGEHQECINLASRRLPTLRSGLRGRLVAEVLVRLAGSEMALSLLESALKHLSEALSITERTAAHSLRCRIKALCGKIYGRKGLHDLSERYWRESLELATIMNDKAEIDRAKAALAVRKATCGELSSAYGDFSALLENARQRGEKVRVGFYLSQLAEIDLEMGRFPEAEKKFLESIQLSTPAGDRSAVIYCLLRLCLIRLEQDKIDVASSLIRKSERIHEKSKHLRVKLAITLMKVRVLLAQPNEADRLLQTQKLALEAAEIATSCGEIAPEIESNWALCLIALRQGKVDEAQRIIRRIKLQAEELDDNRLILMCLHAQAEVFKAIDDEEKAQLCIKRGLRRANETQFARLHQHFVILQDHAERS